MTAPTFIYAGMNGPYSLIPLQRLIEQGLRPQAVLLPQAAPATGSEGLPVQPPVSQQTLVSEAQKHGLDVCYCPDPASLEAVLGALAASTVLVTGWPWRIPISLLGMPEYGWLNLHPSLLPAYRGPAPLFWQLRDGAPLGVSLHRMDTGLDTGPVQAQEHCDVLEGESLVGIESRLAEIGGRLFEEALGLLETGMVLTKQPDEKASSQGWPQAGDYILDRYTDARTACNFFSAMLSAGRQCGFRTKEGVVEVRSVLGWQGKVLRIQCDQGVIEIEMGEA